MRTNLHVHVNTLPLRLLQFSPTLVTILKPKIPTTIWTTHTHFVRSEVFTMPKINSAVLCIMTTCSPTDELEKHTAPTSPVDSDSIFDYNILLCFVHNLWKSKAVLLQADSGPGGSRNLRFPDFMTTAQDDGKIVSPTHQPPLPPGNVPVTHFC